MEVIYIVKYHPLVARDDIPGIDIKYRLRIKKAIERKLTTQPDIFGIPLRRSLKGHRKLRVGDYRIIFRIENNIIFVLAIMHRSIVYERMWSRI